MPSRSSVSWKASPADRPQTPGPADRPQTPGPADRPQTPGPADRPQTPGPADRPRTPGPADRPRMHPVGENPRPSRLPSSNKGSNGFATPLQPPRSRIDPSQQAVPDPGHPYR